MRLTDDQITALRLLTRDIAGEEARVLLFGSRLRDDARGGDVDLLVELPHPVDNPALLAARISARAMRVLHGRNVDVLLSAPNLRRLPIHEIALKEGQVL